LLAPSRSGAKGGFYNFPSIRAGGGGRSGAEGAGALRGFCLGSGAGAGGRSGAFRPSAPPLDKLFCNFDKSPAKPLGAGLLGFGALRGAGAVIQRKPPKGRGGRSGGGGQIGKRGGADRKTGGVK
jgi:hypothetical protein